MLRQLPSSFPSVPLPMQPRNHRRRPHAPTVTVFIPERAFTYAAAQSSEAPCSDSYHLHSRACLYAAALYHRRPHAPTVTVFMSSFPFVPLPLGMQARSSLVGFSAGSSTIIIPLLRSLLERIIHFHHASFLLMLEEAS
jgi:hypothetical protein